MIDHNTYYIMVHGYNRIMAQMIPTRLTEEEPPDMNDLGPAERRAVRARTERMVVVPEVGSNETAIGLYTVHTESTATYTVELGEIGDCDCPDAIHRDPDGGCKHYRRVRMLVETTPLPGPGEPAADYAAALAETHRDLERELSATLSTVRTLTVLAEAADDALDRDGDAVTLAD